MAQFGSHKLLELANNLSPIQGEYIERNNFTKKSHIIENLSSFWIGDRQLQKLVGSK